MAIKFNTVFVGIAISAFAAVTAPLADEPLKFSSEMTGGKIYALANMLAQSGRSDLNFTAAEADFNGDGRLDVLAFAQNSYFCGSGGCAPLLMIANKKGWKAVPFNALSMPENWYLLDSMRNGYRMVVVLGDESEQSYAWDGSAYIAVDN
ncbi:hypothetical protein PSQ19_04685 [Devosia algicola]|uniref:VCBS repeat-containing protein n=1 Tax=Devosia algicola TaxID=3026418 RepID=A0ABY7YQ21_9HYPH|nr:hypothetical protein [Devosia algicola]WDR03419.1 hypothetical protein PSQ19_04685 [Devosia algicola]